VGKPGVAGVYTNQRLSLSKPWEGPRKIGQGFKPDPGNLAVRHYRGASRNVRHGETVTPSRNRKSGNGNPSPTARRARSLSQPWATEKAKRARRAETPKQTKPFPKVARAVPLSRLHGVRNSQPPRPRVMRGLAARLNSKRSQGMPQAGYRAAKRVEFRGADLVQLKRRQHPPAEMAWRRGASRGRRPHACGDVLSSEPGRSHSHPVRTPDRLMKATAER
jgi:hypothetical protein